MQKLEAAKRTPGGASTAPRYAMHKYWGKKPAAGISALIDKYSRPGDTILDPFAGYGVFCCEAFLKNRKVIVNDLNPAANFIARNLFSQEVDLTAVKAAWSRIREEFLPFVRQWYQLTIDGIAYLPISVLRTKAGQALLFTFKDGRKTAVKEIPEELARRLWVKEQSCMIEDWYPDTVLLENSRISVRPAMKTADLFTRRTLACHARLLSLIEKHACGAPKDLLLLAFTANLANCSRLVPPIKSRGALAQGAWMTGFYVGETYIENNVLHYYENRLHKVLRGKEDFFAAQKSAALAHQAAPAYRITSFDAKALQLPDQSMDYVFADPPYGDSVPYFEQSVLWNAWLQLRADYQNEIVISDSRQRLKDEAAYAQDMMQAFSEIRRVLKDGRYFSLTFHSLSGREWRAVSNACVSNNFRLTDYRWLAQKTFTPRQLNRTKTVKGDVLVTFMKSTAPQRVRSYSDAELTHSIYLLMRDSIKLGINDTNGLLMAVMEWVLRHMVLIGEVDVFEILNRNFHFAADGSWCLKPA